MGQERQCRIRIGRHSEAGIAHLDGDTLRFTGQRSVAIPIQEIRSIDVDGGDLLIAHGDAEVAFELGSMAVKWAAKIRSPKSVLDKFGLKPDHAVSLHHVGDATLCAEIRGRCPQVAARLKMDSDAVFAEISDREDLTELTRLASCIKRDGMIWVIWPKGAVTINGDDVFAAATAQKLAAIKVCKISDALSGVKLVIPKAMR